MKKRMISVLGVIATVSLLMTGCGAGQKVEETAEPETTEAAAEDTQKAQEPAAKEQDNTFATYEDPNGWTLQYDKNNFEVNQQDNVVTFVYTGESGGTNMLTVTYDISSKDPGTIVDGLLAEWGDSAVKSEGTFPTDENVPVVRATLPVEEGGSGLYMEAIVRSYMEGCLVFELTGHNSGDEELDMGVSDQMAMLIDSVQFIDYGNGADAQ